MNDEMRSKQVPVVLPPKEIPSERPLRVAAYCRVSTAMEAQETSLEGQFQHYNDKIRSNPQWTCAGIYLETGVSGTKKETRPELQKLLEACRAGEVDLILTKSISRFARNTSDCLEMVRRLTAMGVHLTFEKEHIHTGTMESELMLSLLACLAEEESRSLSNNVKWGLRKRFQRGEYKPPVPPYGYRREGTTFRIVPKEAAVVREIYVEVLEGSGLTAIARKLNERGLRTRRGKRWSGPTIRQMVMNPAYMGDTLYQKTFVDETFRQRPNRGELNRYYETDHHQPIVSREEFRQAVWMIQCKGRRRG